MDENEFKELLNSEGAKKTEKTISIMSDKCALYRGVFIHKVTEMEIQIDEIFSSYFIPKDEIKREELMYAVLTTEKISLSAKYAVVSFLMHRYYQNFYDVRNKEVIQAGKKKGKPDPGGLDGQINEMISLRNKFAHRKYINNFGNVLSYMMGNESISLDTQVAKPTGKILPMPLAVDDKIMMQYCEEIDVLIKILAELKFLLNHRQEEIEKERKKE